MSQPSRQWLKFWRRERRCVYLRLTCRFHFDCCSTLCWGGGLHLLLPFELVVTLLACWVSCGVKPGKDFKSTRLRSSKESQIKSALHWSAINSPLKSCICGVPCTNVMVKNELSV